MKLLIGPGIIAMLVLAWVVNGGNRCCADDSCRIIVEDFWAKPVVEELVKDYTNQGNSQPSMEMDVLEEEKGTLHIVWTSWASRGNYLPSPDP